MQSSNCLYLLFIAGCAQPSSSTISDSNSPLKIEKEMNSQQMGTKLYSDDEIKSLVNYDIDKTTSLAHSIFDIPYIDNLITTKKNNTRQEIMDLLKLDDSRLRGYEVYPEGMIVFLRWQVSNSYELCAMTDRYIQNERNNELHDVSATDYSDPRRLVYGIRFVKVNNSLTY